MGRRKKDSGWTALKAANAGRMCRHCGRFKATRARRLCWKCSLDVGIRALYPSESKFARRGVENFAGDAPLPEPTSVPPGPEKVAVMQARARAGQAIFHPRDAALSDRALIPSFLPDDSDDLEDVA